MYIGRDTDSHILHIFHVGNNYINCVPFRHISCESFTMISEVASESSKLIFSHIVNGAVALHRDIENGSECMRLPATSYSTHSDHFRMCQRHSMPFIFERIFDGGGGSRVKWKFYITHTHTVCECAGQKWHSLNLWCNSNYFWLLFVQNHAKATVQLWGDIIDTRIRVAIRIALSFSGPSSNFSGSAPPNR